MAQMEQKTPQQIPHSAFRTPHSALRIPHSAGAMVQMKQISTQGRSKNPQSQTDLRCKYCGFDTREDFIRGAFWTSTGLVVVEDIPARLCEGCGEQFFAEETTQQIEKLLTHPPVRAKRRTRAWVYSFSECGAAKKSDESEVQGPPHAVSFQSTHHKERPATEPAGGVQVDQETLQCRYCKSKTVERLVISVFWVEGELIVLQNIRARICQRCKEQFYDDGTSDIIAAIQKGASIRGMTRRDETVTVFSLAEAAKCSCRA
jgi:YgiT-type zinc finger domain-containing protein